MPAEIDTDGHWVLHCDPRADCPIATPIHVSTTIASPCADFTRSSSARLPKIDEGEPGERSKRRALKDRRRRVENRASKAESSNRRSENSLSNFDRSSLTRVPRIGDEEETILGDLPAKSRALTEPPSGRRRGRDGHACLALTVSPRAIENVPKDERLSVTWCPRVDASDKVDKVERAESRLRDGTERSRLAIAELANGSSIAERRSLQDRSWTRLRPSHRGRKNLDTEPSDRLADTRTAGESPLLSSHHSHTRSKEETCEDDSKDISERFLDEEFGNDDTWTDEDATGYSGRRDEHPEEDRTRRIDQDSADRKWIGRACRVRSFLQLAFLFFLVAFGRCGPLGSSGVLKFSATTTASGLSVLGFGAIVGAVSAKPIDLAGDAATRAERSANLSHITGASRKIQMYIKNRHLQILPDGMVNGSNDDTSDYTIFQRTSVSRGQLRIQGVATCLYLCMDSCGLLYGSREFTEDCVFNETLEQHNYNTYSSVRWSTTKKTLYLGLNRHGQPRRVQAKGHNLGRLSAYARVLTQVAPLDRVEALQRRMLGAQHNVRHQRHGHGRHRQHGSDVAQQSICPTLPAQEKDGRDRFRCRRRKKRKKRKRRCKPGERPGPQCQVAEGSTVGPMSDVTEVDASVEITSASITTPESKRSCEGAASEEACRRQALSVPAKKRKSRIDNGGRNLTLNGKNKAPTSNAKKPNVSVADSQSKKPDLTDGKKRRRKGTPRTSRGDSTAVPPSRKRYGPGTTSSHRASSPLTAPISAGQRASTATSSSSPSPPGASTALFSVRRPGSPASGRRKPSPSSRNHVARPAGSRRVGKFFPGTVDSQARPPWSTPATSAIPKRETARPPPSITKVPETTSPLPQSWTVLTSLSLPWQESAEDSSSSLSNSSLVDEDPSSSIVTSEFTTGAIESITSTASSEIVVEATTLKLDEEDGEDGGSGVADTNPRTTTRYPWERLAM